MQITAVKNYEQKKNAATSGMLIKAVYASYVYVYIYCTSWSGTLEYNSLFVGLGGWGVRGSERKIYRKAVDEDVDGLECAGGKGGGGVRLGWLPMTRRHLDWITRSLR